MSDVNLLAVLAATVAMFATGAIWYMPIFGKAWGEMHGFEKLSKKEQKEMQAKMGPYYLAQAAVTFANAFVLAKLMAWLPEVSIYQIAFCTWVGFLVPAAVSGIIFGGGDAKWIPRKIAITVAGSLVCNMVAVFVINLFN
jgi:hypothetical protein